MTTQPKTHPGPGMSGGDPAKPVAEVPLGRLDMGRFGGVLSNGLATRLLTEADGMAEALAGRRVWNVSSTAQGGGVAEMLHSMLAYERGRGIDARWCVIGGDESFFAVTKRIHNHLHESPGDGAPLDSAARRAYEATLARSGPELRALIRPGDLVTLHDPQTAGLLPWLEGSGAHIVWRSHVGSDSPGEVARAAWSFLRSYLGSAEYFLFSRGEHVWDGLDRRRVRIVQPAIDPFSAKNQNLAGATVDAILAAARILPPRGSSAPAFLRSNGSAGLVGRTAEMLGAPGLDPDLPIVCQVSRWDRLKDPTGVMLGFVEHVLSDHDAQLILAGPETGAVVDDPEGAAVLDEIRETWRSLEPRTRARVAVACLPMIDAEENAAVVNALQRRSDVVVQKSLAEGFGLTVAEAMWKGRPLVASRVGGIQDQVEDGVSGLLLAAPEDLAAFGQRVGLLLDDPETARRVGAVGRSRVRERFLLARMLVEHLGLYSELLGAEPSAARTRAPLLRWLRPLAAMATRTQ